LEENPNGSVLSATRRGRQKVRQGKSSVKESMHVPKGTFKQRPAAAGYSPATTGPAHTAHHLRADNNGKTSVPKNTKNCPFTLKLLNVYRRKSMAITSPQTMTSSLAMTSSGQQKEEMQQCKSGIQGYCRDSVVSPLMCTGLWLMASSWSHLMNLSFHHIGITECTKL
jgi:hypothetical protein